ncbi:MAG TPA: ArsR family transcriptional regulator, partial [Bifidobacterium sp.]|nr:ArsR family transcriptional regulator [Bifidobacterium sp.]
ELPQEWADSCTSDDHVLNLTAEEMRLMVEELNEVIHRWRIKADMHGDDGADIRPIALILQAFRWFS